MDLDWVMLALVCGAVWGIVRVTVAWMDRSAEREFLALQRELDEITSGRLAQPDSADDSPRQAGRPARRPRLQAAF